MSIFKHLLKAEKDLPAVQDIIEIVSFIIFVYSDTISFMAISSLRKLMASFTDLYFPGLSIIH